jgi:phage shock protein A
MKDTITQRVSRIIAGNVHALVDLAENANPKAIQQQAIREIDNAVTEVRTELGKEKVELHAITKRIAEAKADHAELLQQIETAIREERDDLAEAGIAKQMDIEVQRGVLEEARALCEADIKKYQGYVDAMLARKREMENVFAQKEAAEKAVNGSAPAKAAVDRAESAYNRVMDGAAPVTPQQNETEAALDELAELDRQNRIQSRLAALKTTAKRHD